jgi:ATP-binding cassette subfamily C protein
MIFDEPTNALDEESVGVFMNEIIKKKKSKIVIIVSHDIRLGEIADEVINF